MMEVANRIFVISDLHIGGSYPAAGEAGRGFRINTNVKVLTCFVRALAALPSTPRVELVINGDFVDFLAEAAPEGGNWVPLIKDPEEAAKTFDQIACRDRPFFLALGDLCGAGHFLTVLLGNHDVELSFPAVRERLLKAMGLARRGSNFQFIFDGEAYRIGGVLIEHGNRYDEWNVVDMSALRRMRSLQSRSQPEAGDSKFVAPAGSHMVASVMNPIKRRYPFVDLLKPETAAAVPILLALDPGLRAKVAAVSSLAVKASHHSLKSSAMPSLDGDCSLVLPSAELINPSENKVANVASAENELVIATQSALGDIAASQFLSEIAGVTPTGPAELETPGPMVGDMGFVTPSMTRALGMFSLLTAISTGNLSARLPALRLALRGLEKDRSFDIEFEVEAPYLSAAKELSTLGASVVVFGHTHLAKRIPLPGGGVYLNTGTWADLLQVPAAALGDGPEASASLEGFVRDLTTDGLQKWTVFRPSFALIELTESDEIVSAQIKTFKIGDDLNDLGR